MNVIRGAVFLNEDSSNEVNLRTIEMMEKIFDSNSLSDEDVVSVIFSVTKDVRSMNPATVFRKAGHDLPLMCVQEADFSNSPRMVIRAMVFVNGNIKPEHVYENGAEDLKDWRWEN